MNNRVRIYELSRELNLDNKDILAVCDQLNIAVKSHSSTITEPEAERIRTAAEKYTSNHSPHPIAAQRRDYPSHRGDKCHSSDTKSEQTQKAANSRSSSS